MGRIEGFLKNYIGWISIPDIGVTDVIEILIMAYLIYHLVNYIRRTKAWALLRGVSVIAIIWLVSTIFELNVLKFIIENTFSVGIIAVIVLFQPEFRKALEQLGQRNIVRSITIFDDSKDQVDFTEKDIDELVTAAFALSRTKTGALIVIQCMNPLTEYENTGIAIDALITSQLLINIFEHNTPLHDGAVTIVGNRITYATCYLPMSDNNKLSKELGTRHRAGVGASEATDAFVLIVSEETGKVSIARGGQLVRNVDEEYLRSKLCDLIVKSEESRKIKFWKGSKKDEK